MKLVIFGAGIRGRKYLMDNCVDEIVCFVDNDKAAQNRSFHGVPVKSPEILKELEYDKIVVAVTGHQPVVEQLLNIGIPNDKIEVFSMFKTDARIRWIRYYAPLVYKLNISGNVAEAGVYKGTFAAEINSCFPDKKLYLFDTFEGFTDEDISREKHPSRIDYEHDNTSVETVLQKMKYPENCIIRKGWFPQTAFGIDDKFCFVCLDMDLYQPTLSGLQFFWDKMSDGGVILVHDYYGSPFPNIEQAVEDFKKSLPGETIRMFPTGDTISIAIIK